MTYQITVTDQGGAPVSGALVSVSILETGRVFQRATDGNGYADVALLDGAPKDSDALLSVVATGYQVFTAYEVVPAENVVLGVRLVPFV